MSLSNISFYFGTTSGEVIGFDDPECIYAGILGSLQELKRNTYVIVDRVYREESGIDIVGFTNLKYPEAHSVTLYLPNMSLNPDPNLEAAICSVIKKRTQARAFKVVTV